MNIIIIKISNNINRNINSKLKKAHLSATHLKELEERNAEINTDNQVLVPELHIDRQPCDEDIDGLEGAVGGVINNYPNVHNIQVEIHEHSESNDELGAEEQHLLQNN